MINDLQRARSPHFSACVIAVILSGGLTSAMFAAEPGASTSFESDPPLRSPWTRGPIRFERNWLLLGPIVRSANGDAAPADAIAAHPVAGQSQTVAGAEFHWRSVVNWSDVIDIPGALGLAPTEAPAEIIYAYATLTRDHTGDAELSLGCDGGISVWVNGTVVHDRKSTFVFSADRERVPVHLKAGANDLLLRLDHQRGPWRFAARVFEPGAIVPRLEEITPAIEENTPEQVTVRTHIAPEPGAAPVRIEIVGAGGKILAQAEAPRGESARFAPAAWPDGAYEFRCTTTDSWGHAYVTNLPYYKGDVLAAARRLLDAARSAPPDASGATVRMLADLIRDRLGKNLENKSPDAWLAIHSALLEFEELNSQRSSGTGAVRAGGFVRLAWIDDVDGSPQFCRAYLPPGYDASRRWPVVIVLHGFNPENPPYVRWWSVDQRHNSIADRHGVIVLEPHGRGNAQYLGIGERDVLHCLAEARRQFAVDEDRVYVTGESMGGHGTWAIATRHPDLFAAAAPIFGGWDFRIQPPERGGWAGIVPANWHQAWIEELSSSFTSAENLRNLPMFVHHGDADQTVDVGNSRHAVRMLQRWGYDIRYEEQPGYGHEDLGAFNSTVQWLLAHRRPDAPRTIRLRTGDLATASAYWIQVEAREEPVPLIKVDAEVVTPGAIRLDTSNVATVALALPPALRGEAANLHVVWNGQAKDVPLHEGRAELSTLATRPAALRKTAGHEGLIANFIATPFAVVVGTSSQNPLMQQRCREKAAAFAQLWESWQKHPPRQFRDDQITEADEKNYSLLLIGGPDDNLVSHRIATRLPLQLGTNTITIDGRTWPASDALVQMIYPSPFDAARYVMIVAATSSRGMYLWRPALWHIPYGFPVSSTYWDWTIQDGHEPIIDASHGPEQGWIAAGIFDSNWQRADRWTLLGDAELRAKTPVRHPAPSGFSAPAEILSAAAGRYRLSPGVDIALTLRDGKLFFENPNVLPTPLIAESEMVFANSATGDQLILHRNSAGRINEIALRSAGRETTWQRAE